MTTTSTPKSKSFDVPKSESGLAEWASKIKAMQRQVDEDDEAEQRKLEEEIAASRMKRMRRSQMYSRPGTPDPAGTDPAHSGAPRELTEDSSSSGDRSTTQSDALRKLTGASERSQLPPTVPTTPAKQDGVSLAAFIGGRATGPRLKKHHPQQDAHDPTQFDQRTTVTAPHPVFGRGGVAMPGMASRTTKTTTAMSQVVVEYPSDSGSRSAPSWSYTAPALAPVAERPDPVLPAEPSFPSKPTDSDRKPSTPAVVRRYVEQIHDTPIVPQKTGLAHRARSKSRERTVSTPTGAFPMRSITPSLSTGPSASPRPVSAEITKSVSASPSTPIRKSVDVTPAPSPSSYGRLPTHRYSTPSSSTPSPASSIPLKTPSLARSVQPTPRPAAFGPQVTPPVSSSPAFLRAPTAKQPTPSLSRLKGRGFVQSMVRTSTELQAAAEQVSPVAPEKPGRPAKRLSNVLERWPGVSTPSPPPSPLAAAPPKALPLVHVRDFAEQAISVASASPPAKPLKNSPSLPKLADEGRTIPKKKSFTQTPFTDEAAEARKVPGLGSSNTLISYIKPMKTGDDPVVASPPRPKTPAMPPLMPKTLQADAGELGLRTRRSNGAVRGRASGPSTPTPATSMPLTAGIPLSHPTKGRARKPRKGEKAKEVSFQETPTAAALMSRRDHAGGGERVAVQRPMTAYTASVAAVIDPVTVPPLAISAAEPIPRSSRIVNAGPVAFPVVAPAVDDAITDAVPRPSRTAKITDKWADMPLIGVKAPQPPRSQESLGSGRPSAETNSMLRRALPGMAPTPGSTSPAPPAIPTQERAPPHERTPSTPRQRVPSTGSRARVMEVAQAFKDYEELSASPDVPIVPKDKTPSPSSESPVQVTPPHTLHAATAPTVDVPTDLSPVSPMRPRVASPTTERRSSSYNDKYAAIAMPPLREETPTSSPAGTLSRGAKDTPVNDNASVLGVRKSRTDPEQSVSTPTPEKHAQVSEVHFGKLPSVDINRMLQTKPSAFSFPSDTRIVSLDVMSIIGTTASALRNDIHTFYDVEVLAIIQRSKSSSSGLVATSVWGWFGKNAKDGEKEERKLQELSKRYGTTLVHVHQHREPPELVHAIGGQLAIRQGSRTHWSSENTAMHVVRSVNGSLFIDEHDLNVASLCSAFSYCLTILDTLYVWYGRGSIPAERKAALGYARSLGGRANIVELSEGENDDDEMFWMILGSEDYAKADYWKWRPISPISDTRAWRVDTASTDGLELLPWLPESATINDFVHILDCHWELFVVVGQQARGDRPNIALALNAAKELSRWTANQSPFIPAVHVLVLPSQIPVDLRMCFRGLDETLLNNGDVPDHMNILHHAVADYHLQTRSWAHPALTDAGMLPLGVHPNMLPEIESPTN